MAAVANRMANLDFDAKVTVTQDDELGELGYSMNQLSEKLESTIEMCIRDRYINLRTNLNRWCRGLIRHRHSRSAILDIDNGSF